MTAQLEALATRFRFNEGLLKMATDGFEAGTWATAPTTGGNTAHWILGHVTHARHGLLRMAGMDLPQEEWEAPFGKDAVPTDGSDYLPADELLAKFRAAGETISSHFAAITDEASDASIGRQFPDGSSTVGGALHFMYFHETYHLGQIGLLRRMAGLPGFV